MKWFQEKLNHHSLFSLWWKLFNFKHTHRSQREKETSSIASEADSSSTFPHNLSSGEADSRAVVSCCFVLCAGDSALYVSGEWVSLKARSHILTDSEKWVDLKNVLWKLKPLRSDTDIFNFRQSNQQLAAVAVAAVASTKDCFMFEIIKNELVSTVLCNFSRFFRCDFSTATQHTTAAVLSGTYRKRLKLLGCLDSDFPNETLISYKINSKINIPFFKHRKWAGQASSHRISLAEQQKEKLNYNFLLPQRVRFMKNCWWLKSHQSSSGQQARAREENSKKKKIEQIFPPFGAIFFLHFLQHFHLPSRVLFRIAPTFKFYYLCARKSHASKKASQDEHSREADQFSSSRQMKHFFPFPSDSLARTLNNKTLVRAERNLFSVSDKGIHV